MSNWGGSRAGAGRPSLGDTERVFSDITSDLSKRLNRVAKVRKESRSALIRDLLNREIDEMEKEVIMIETLEKFLASADFAEGCRLATRSSWKNSGMYGEYSVELFSDGSWRILCDEMTGNLYESTGVILGLPILDDNDYQECVVDGDMSEDDYFFAVFQNDEEELKQEMRDKLR